MKEFIKIGNQVFVAKKRFRLESSATNRDSIREVGFHRNEFGEVLYAQPGRLYAATESELRTYHGE